MVHGIYLHLSHVNSKAMKLSFNLLGLEKCIADDVLSHNTVNTGTDGDGHHQSTDMRAK